MIINNWQPFSYNVLRLCFALLLVFGIVVVDRLAERNKATQFCARFIVYASTSEHHRPHETEHGND